ncbi:MAG TPA: hypothetical protein VGB17_14430 [Pyrinomonadaceae bacterium]|jgi:hypothetical protein
MPDATKSRYDTGNPLCDAVRYINDATYAVLPRDVAHRLGELEKNFWSGVRCFVDKELNWIDERLEGSDRLREEWREAARQRQARASAGSGI